MPLENLDLHLFLLHLQNHLEKTHNFFLLQKNLRHHLILKNNIHQENPLEEKNHLCFLFRWVELLFHLRLNHHYLNKLKSY